MISFTAAPGGHLVGRLFDVASARRRSGRVLTITYLGLCHAVLRHPPDRRTGIEYRVSDVKTVTRSVSGPGGGRSVISISRPHDVERVGSWPSHTSADTIWCSDTRVIDERVLYTASVT